jgi:hypothetical protein
MRRLSMLDPWTIRANIRRFRELLKDEKDEHERRTLEELLAGEESKLLSEDERKAS